MSEFNNLSLFCWYWIMKCELQILRVYRLNGRKKTKAGLRHLSLLSSFLINMVLVSVYDSSLSRKKIGVEIFL